MKASAAHRGQPDPAQLAFLATEDDERRPEDASAFGEEFPYPAKWMGSWNYLPWRGPLEVSKPHWHRESRRGVCLSNNVEYM